jgi:PPOX class probable F420-dependent enzyme
MAPMAQEEIREFLSAGTRTGKLATTRKDGRPHVMPIWFVLDGDDVVFTTGANTVKGRNIRRDGRVSMLVDDEQPPFAYVQVNGSATWEDNPSNMLDWATRIAARYMGEDQDDAYGRRNAVPGELLVRFTPERTVAEANVAGW